MLLTTHLKRRSYGTLPTLRAIATNANKVFTISPCSTRFAVALCMALRLKRGAFALLATVCSTWVFINRATSGRSIWNPLGRQGVKCVDDANVTLPM